MLSHPWGPGGAWRSPVQSLIRGLTLLHMKPRAGGMAGGGRRRLRPHISSVPGRPILKLPFTPPFNPYYHLVRKVLLFLVYRWENRLIDTVTRPKSNRSGRIGISEPV